MRKAKMLGAAALVLALAFAVFGNPLEHCRRRALRQAMAAVEDGAVTLDEIVPFQWDCVYSFDPYTTREQMAEIMGIPARGLAESPSEGMVQLAFVKGGRVVCGVCEYISRAGYSVSFEGKVEAGEGTVFEAERSPEGVLRLERAV